jgi:hypothetical protein
VGRAFSNVATAMAVGGYPGLHTTTPPTSATAYGIYWPALVNRELVEHVVVLPGGDRRVIAHSPSSCHPAPASTRGRPGAVPGTGDNGPVARVPLGRVVGARSGDKGGNANVGLWARSDRAFAWLRDRFDVDLFVALLPEARGLRVHRHEFPNLRAVNFVVVGLLGDGVSSSTRPDPQAKGLGEFLRSRFVEVPEQILREKGHV